MFSFANRGVDEIFEFKKRFETRGGLYRHRGWAPLGCDEKEQSVNVFLSFETEVPDRRRHP